MSGFMTGVVRGATIGGDKDEGKFVRLTLFVPPDQIITRSEETQVWVQMEPHTAEWVAIEILSLVERLTGD